MKFDFLDSKSAPRFLERVRRIESGQQRRWGTMDPPALFAHLRRGIEISIGEYKVKDDSIPILRNVLRFLFFDTGMAFPKGAKAPAFFFPDNVADRDRERALLEAVVGRFVAALEKEPGKLNPSSLFGPLPLSYWAKIHGKHLEHHLQQYGQ